MKKFLIAAAGVLFLVGAKAQEVSVGVDVYNRYVFRGVDFGGSPSIQPTVEFTMGSFTLGAWGAYATNADVTTGANFAEADLYLSYDFDFGLSLGATSYYYPPSSWFEFDGKTASHAFELNLGYEISGFSLGANYILNDTSEGGPLTAGGDMYFELGYEIGNVGLFLGAGDGWHSANGNMQVVNIGIGTSKDIVITDSFTLPLSGSLIMNPNSEQLHIVVGLSF